MQRHTIRPTLCTLLTALAIGGCGGGSSSGSSTTAPAPVPISPTVPATAERSLAARVDNVVSNFMRDNGATAVTVSVVRNGVVVYDKGHGFLDAARSRALPADAPMVTASIVKPVTAAAIQHLAAARKLALTDHAFCTGDNAPCWLPKDLMSASTDPRVRNITIGQLIAHQGGWSTPGLGEVIYERPIQIELGLSTPPVAADVVRYFLRRQLDFAPGSRTSYANFGYLILGMIIQQASGMTYTDYVNAHIMGPLGIPPADFKVFSSRVKDRDAREPNYINRWRGTSVYEPGQSVAYDDGVANSVSWASVGTTATTAKAMALFAGRYLILPSEMSGIPSGGMTNNSGHWGSLAFSLSVVRQLPTGVSYAVMANAETGSHQQLSDSMDAAIAGSID